MTGGIGISLTATLCTKLWQSRLSRCGLADPMMLQPRAVLWAKGSVSVPVMTSKGASADGQS